MRSEVPFVSQLLPGFTPSAVLFDMDGTLLQTEQLYTEAIQSVLDAFGLTFEWSLKERMMGRPRLEAASLLVQELKLPMGPEAFLDRREATLLRLLAEADEIPGAEAFTQRLKLTGIPMAVATSSDSTLYRIKTTKHRRWFSEFQLIVCGDDPRIARPKPHPDIFLLTASELGVEPGQCLVFEDSPAGVESALAGGMKVIAVPDPQLNAALIRGAHRIIRDYKELLVD